jgi:fatty acid desaturase
MSTAPIPHLSPDLLESSHQMHSWRNGVRIGLFVLIYLTSATLTIQLSLHVGAWWQWGLLAPLYLLSAASLHGISLFTHEAVHGTLAKNPLLNNLLGALCAFPVLQTCAAYRVLHLKHHQHLGNDGDPDHYENYTRWTWMVFLMNWLRLLIGYPVYITAIPIMGFRQGATRDRWWIAGEVLVLLTLMLLVGFCPIPRTWLLHGWLIPMLCINSMVNIRGMSQHTLLEHASDEVLGTRTILTSRLVRFFMCNENYHLEHHLYPGVPWYGLPRVHQELREGLRAHGAPYIPTYSSFVWEFVCDSFRRSPLGWSRRPPQAQNPS